jgi:hypothetical protein
MKPLRALIPLIACVISACAAPGPTPTQGPSSAPSAAGLPTIDEGDLVSGRLSCGGDDSFPAAALQGPGGAEFGGDAVAAGLRAVLADSADPELPPSGWRLVSISASKAQFVAPGAGGRQWSSISLVQNGQQWTMASVGECRLAVLVGNGIGHATWWLDAAAGPVGPETREVHALVHEEACAGGRAPIGRVVPPLIAYGGETVIVVFGVKPLVGDSDCPGAPPAPYTFDLRQPLGNRALLDGGVVPPRDATKPPG